MGQTNSQPTEHPKTIKTTKNIIIEIGDTNMELTVDSNLTTGWLISEVIRNYTGDLRIVSLKTNNSIEIMDEWLNLYYTDLSPLADNQILQAVLEEPVSGRINGSHFTPIKSIGRGAFSKVILARQKNTGQLFAIKTIKKSLALTRMEQIILERKLHEKLDHPCIVKHHWCYESRDCLHMVLDFCAGGELFFHLQSLGRFSEVQARFYFCEILLALEYLHNLDIVYRDLKPENILIDFDGHVKLADFGLAKRLVTERARSFCGSPEYMPPEMLLRKGHGKEVDIYGLGVLLYEMLTGLPPFYHPDKDTMHEMVLYSPLQLPRHASKEVRNLLSSLLHKNYKKRIGAAEGISSIKKHPWIASVDWEALYAKEIFPPTRPSLDTSNFDPEFMQEDIEEYWGPDEFKEDQRFSKFCKPRKTYDIDEPNPRAFHRFFVSASPLSQADDSMTPKVKQTKQIVLPYKDMVRRSVQINLKDNWSSHISLVPDFKLAQRESLPHRPRET